MTLLPSKIKIWPQVNQINWPQILERFVEKEKNVAQIKILDGVRDFIHYRPILTIWSEGYRWNQLVELILLIPNSIFHVKVSCQSIRLIRHLLRILWRDAKVSLTILHTILSIVIIRKMSIINIKCFQKVSFVKIFLSASAFYRFLKNV